MAEFLSAAWISELAEAAEGARDLSGPAGRIVVEQVVLGTPFGDVRYQVEWTPDRASVKVPPGPPVAGDDDGGADLVLVTDYPTARALHDGRTRAQDALAAGALKIRGSPERLADGAAALDSLALAFGAVRTRTTFAEGATAAGRSASGEG